MAVIPTGDIVVIVTVPIILVCNIIHTEFLANVMLYAIVGRLSSVTLVHPTQAIEIFGSVLRHLVPWPPVDIRLPLLCLTPPTEGFPWDDLRKILPGFQWVAKVPNVVERLPKISIA